MLYILQFSIDQLSVFNFFVYFNHRPLLEIFTKPISDPTSRELLPPNSATETNPEPKYDRFQLLPNRIIDFFCRDEKKFMHTSEILKNSRDKLL